MATRLVGIGGQMTGFAGCSSFSITGLYPRAGTDTVHPDSLGVIILNSGQKNQFGDKLEEQGWVLLASSPSSHNDGTRVFLYSHFKQLEVKQPERTLRASSAAKSTSSRGTKKRVPSTGRKTLAVRERELVGTVRRKRLRSDD